MQYDIFISYSREDSRQVDSLINFLRREIPGIKLWYDREGLETAEEFHDRIIEAIDESRAVIFACSANSMSSRYCKKEVMYAKTIGKTVIPYLLPGMTLKGWLLFEFGNINCIRSTHIEEINRMVRDIKRWSEQDNGNSNNGGSNSSTSDFQNTGSSSPQSQNITNNSNNTMESQLEFDSITGEFKQRNNNINNLRIGAGVGYINGHEYVDLGLPSGLKWATCNVGASKPEGYGNYYAWGEVKTKSIYTETNCPSFEKDIRWLRSNGYINANGNLTPSHDAASQVWGGTWRMPKLNDFKELLDNTVEKAVTLNGVKGYLLKSMNNSNNIFFPAAGFRIEDSLEATSDFGNYWSSTPHGEYYQESYLLAFDSDFSCDYIADNRCLGRSVRAVSE